MSHSTSKTVSGILRKVGIDESALACGAHAPLDRRAAAALPDAPTALHNNCSGKHSGMLAFAQLMGWPLDGYIEPGHPVQVAIREALREVLGCSIDAVTTGIDGCSAPTYGVPLRAAATAYARLGRPDRAPEPWRGSLAIVTRAMRANPVHVGGLSGRLDTDLMRGGGGLVAKVGAEGFFGVGGPAGGLAVKVLDGDPTWRAHPVATVSALESLGWLRANELAALDRYGPVVPILNWARRRTGEMTPSEALRALT